MQGVEDYLREREQARHLEQSVPVLSQVIAFVVSGVVIGVALNFVPASWVDLSAAPSASSLLSGQPDERDLRTTVRAILNARDAPLDLSSMTKALASEATQIAWEASASGPAQQFHEALVDLADRRQAYTAASNIVAGLGKRANALEKAYKSRHAVVDKMAPLLTAFLNEAEQADKGAAARLEKIAKEEHVLADLAKRIDDDRDRLRNLRQAADDADKAVDVQRADKVVPAEQRLADAQARLASSSVTLKGAIAQMGTLRREIQEHSRLVLESRTKGAALAHRKTTTEALLKGISLLETDLVRLVLKGGINEVEAAIRGQRDRVAAATTEYDTVPDVADTEDTDAQDTLTVDHPSLKGYRKRMARIAMDEAVQRLEVLEEVRDLLKAKSPETVARQETLIRGHMERKRSPLLADLSATEDDIVKENAWHARIQPELASKTERVTALEAETSESTISKLRREVDDAKAALDVAKTELAGLERLQRDHAQRYEASVVEANAPVAQHAAQLKLVASLRDRHDNSASMLDSLRARVETSIRDQQQAIEEINDLRRQSVELSAEFETARRHQLDTQAALDKAERLALERWNDLKRTVPKKKM
ncbi:Chromosome partition protein Smc [Plasmodiophora brassicae]|uniref:Uncharacterized protein n=1 Tax=Plasmodiophora brassicae TaxID=37360 RepID=A0A0G4J3C5_PLABS|nr:hypothetical protein PBRA_002350 [Plasmodiophora brassicae]SPQ93722.1 unnamed protein product [Plasmodiophora brassicae]